MKFTILSQEDREFFFTSVFGEWKERAELNDILFPEAKNKSSSMSQLFGEKGKSFGVIASALEILLSVEPMAGTTNLNNHGAEHASDNEFKADVVEFFKNAKQHYRRYNRTMEVERIIMAADKISSLAESATGRNGIESYFAIKTLWQGIVAMTSNMHRIPFGTMKEISEPLARAVSKSIFHCPSEQIAAMVYVQVETLRKVLAEKMASVWKHAILGPKEAKDSFSVFTRLMGEKVPPKTIDAFCRAIPKGEERLPHYHAGHAHE